MTKSARDYLLITPCRDEAAHARITLDCVVNQTVRPARWLIVDDGSTDGTSEILAEYAAAHDWITVLPKPNRGARAVGPGVVEAFYFAYDQVDASTYTYVCKQDLDLDLPPRYYETLIEIFEADPRVGTWSGKPYVRDSNGELTPETAGDEMSVGMTKFYRVNCFEQIGGFVREVMWDGIDCHRCRMLGWKAGSTDAEHLRYIHLRPMGSSQQSIWVGRQRHGFGQWFMGTGPVFMAASAVFRMRDKPLIVGGFALFFGYLKAALAGKSRYDDMALRRFLRRYHRLSLIKGKANAVHQIDDEQADIWSP
ncbi:glycosyltransferase family 2 protein [bacterium]|nr:glycosyltransferase family 2 protein [bacterium]